MAALWPHGSMASIGRNADPIALICWQQLDVRKKMNHNIVHMNHKRFDITIHGLDASVYRRIEDRARRQHTSLNRTIKEIIEQSVGGAPRTVENPFADLCGILPADEAALLLEAEEDFERVDPEDWL